MEYDWTDEQVLQMIEEIKKYPCLWHPKHKDRKNRTKKFSAYADLGKRFDCSAEDIKRKFGNLLQSYRSCRRKVRYCKEAGDVYKPVWFAYETLHKFMKDIYLPYGSAHATAAGKDSETEDNNPDPLAVGVEDVDEEVNKPVDEPKAPSEQDDLTESFPRKRVLTCQGDVLMHKRRAKRSVDHRVQEAYEYLLSRKKKVEEDREKSLESRDESAIFGELVTTRLRKLDDLTRQVVMNDINTLLFRATIGKQTSTKEFPTFLQSTKNLLSPNSTNSCTARSPSPASEHR